MSEFILGFSGTRFGATAAQERTLGIVLASLNPAPAEFWHGDCVGADVQFHDRVLRTFGGTAVFQLWPSNLRTRAHCEILYKFPGNRYTIHEPADPVLRTRHIANSCRVLIITPRESEPMPRGGTWLAYHTALARRKQIIIIWPDGHTEEK